MNRLTDLVLAHRRSVALRWLLVAVAGGATASRTVDRLSYEVALPGQPAHETDRLIGERFSSGGPKVSPSTT